MADKIVLITGASRGIGAAIAKRFSALDCIVLINYLKSKKEAELLKKEIELLGGKAELVKGDISKEQDIKDIFLSIKGKYKRLDCLVNNASLSGGFSKVVDLSYEILEKVFLTNTFGAILCAREALKIMRSQKFGNIINITSEAAKFGGVNMSHYAASKAAVEVFTKALAREAAEYNVRVNAVSPSVIDTDSHKDVPEERKKALLGSIPCKRMGEPKEVADVVFWLDSDQSSYVSGSIVSVSGAR